MPRKSPCPVCGKPAIPATDPFCSYGCKDRDLLQWLSDGHRLPGPAVDDPDFDAHGVDS